MKDLTIKQSTNTAWFIYQKNKVLVGGHDKSLIERIKVFLENDGNQND